MMKHIAISILTALLFAGFVPVSAMSVDKDDDSRTPFSIKAYPFRGLYLDKNTHFEKFGGGYPAGVNMGIELPSQRKYPWQQYLNDATAGLGVTWINLGHEMLGHAVAVYPYLLFNAINTEHFQMRFKVAGGLAGVTENWYTQEDTDPDHYYEPTVNTVFGCPINVYLSAGINLNVPITKYLAAGVEFAYFHMSNGRTNMPNIGANALYGSLGITATFNHDAKSAPKRFPSLPYGWAVNITGAAGLQKSAIADPNRFLISSVHVGGVYHVNDWYGIGLGLDVFYNDAVTKNTDRNLYCDGSYDIDGKIVDCTTCGSQKDVDYGFAQKTRAGLAINNEFKFGAVTAIVDWGVYFYNPSRNIYYDYHKDNHGQTAPKRKLFYESPHGAGSEEAFHYIRFGLKYRIWDNLYLHTSAKTHLHICEYVEFGLGYQIPFLKKQNRKNGDSIVFHHRKNWWKD